MMMMTAGVKSRASDLGAGVLSLSYSPSPSALGFESMSSLNLEPAVGCRLVLPLCLTFTWVFRIQTKVFTFILQVLYPPSPLHSPKHGCSPFWGEHCVVSLCCPAWSQSSPSWGSCLSHLRTWGVFCFVFFCLRKKYVFLIWRPEMGWDTMLAWYVQRPGLCPQHQWDLAWWHLGAKAERSEGQLSLPVQVPGHLGLHKTLSQTNKTTFQNQTKTKVEIVIVCFLNLWSKQGK